MGGFLLEFISCHFVGFLRFKKIYFMEDSFQVFDMHRMFIGDDPPLFMLEIVLRTLVMYAYTIFLLRVLGKRGMGQLSMLELAIIISFGSAVGDPMVGADMPILHGIVAITAVTIFQIGLEKLINKNKSVEKRLEGQPSLVVYKGVIQWEKMFSSNLSKEDLFRLLRGKDIKHLGQVERAYFETSGQISVMFFDKQGIRPGLILLPENDMDEDRIFSSDHRPDKGGLYCCMECGNTENYSPQQEIHSCGICNGEKWIPATE